MITDLLVLSSKETGTENTLIRLEDIVSSMFSENGVSLYILISFYINHVSICTMQLLNACVILRVLLNPWLIPSQFG